MASNSGNTPGRPMASPGASQPVQPQAPVASPFQNLFQSPLQSQMLGHGHAHLLAQNQAQAHSPFQVRIQPQSQTSPLGIVAGASSSPSFSTPSSLGVKRPIQKPPVRPPVPPAATMSPIFKTAELTPAARRKKQKLPEKQLPDRVAALLPESAIYTQLLEFEARVDAALSRKKIDVQDALKYPPCSQKTLRVYIFNTADPPSWSLKIVGRILEEGSDPDAKSSHLYPKFSAFFKRVTVNLDPNLYPENPTVVWENARSSAPQEGFEIKRKGDKEFVAGIRLEMNHVPEKFKLSPALQEVLGIEVDTRARITAGIWHYVKARKLQNPSDPSFFSCDPPLRKVFGEEKMKFSFVSQKISQHLSPPPPIHLEHHVKLSGNGAVGNACYDILVDVPFPLHREMATFLMSTEKHKEIEQCDELICASIKKIHEHRRRRAFFLGFSQSPVDFINALIASQSRDLKLVAGEANRNAERERRSDFYNQPWVEDAVIRYLNRKPAPGSEPAGNA
ncbi:SWI/SNF complex component SNF12 homolog [Wolffia australiana]